jgi:small subunit ribosomal protein S14
MAVANTLRRRQTGIVRLLEYLFQQGLNVASKSKIAKALRTPKYSTRLVRRCGMCGRPRAVYRKFGICRICFRKLADQGVVPGVRKASW